jgi:hypothetical protein
MSTGIFIMSDPDGIPDVNPYQGVEVTNLTPGGSAAPVYQRYTDPNTSEPGREPRGGISYIDQSVGGVAGIRSDAMAGPRSGIRSYRSRTQPFNGEFVGARMIDANRRQGPVGSQRKSTVQRTVAAVATNIPDRGDVVAGFTNPALAAMLRLFRKGE